ncbi:myosin phosphatase Rho-interacting protein-like isoform X2 [Cheilinus undulatus]|uniref:myosin phosphatase Rho-interacting protein-like isoform X2 n=1 Tax=Cheilinus undulatus TaxID=241271 RepID=UPI001BD4F44A|nr:myosin phosphatase Rho-interacting protein-like isoform X2 [Cheilinus undulatus]
MSTDRATSPCNKFQANIFNKSKCQNCFKPRELHLLNDLDMEQVKPVYGGWLCLAPEGTDFENPIQRSRKWQRRFFILYEDGRLSFALDELPSTLPQGTTNLNLCSEVSDAETKTGQKNALCITTPQQEVFIRGDSKEIINGWSDQLAVFLRTNKQNQKKKRKVEPVTSQEPSPAKMAATDQSFLSSESPAESRSGDRSPSLSPVCSDPGLLCDQDCSLDLLSCRNMDADRNNNKDQDRMLERKQLGGSAERLQGLDEQEDGSKWSRREGRTNKREKLQSCGDINQLCTPQPQRRTRSLDRRTTDTVITPDLLNFKKGWLVKLDENEQSKKYWFVLSTNSLRFYRDSLAEESSELEGEIKLMKCFKVSEFEVQRNYGFQIHTPDGVFTLSAMTAGIRRSWIQALMRNVHPVNTPDVTSLPGLQLSPELLLRPDLTLDSSSAQRDAEVKHISVKQRRREGRYRTFDWAGFKSQDSDSQSKPSQEPTPQITDYVSSEDRRRSREERRRRYESMLGFSPSPGSQQRVEEEMEDYWRKVETIFFRPENCVPVFTEGKDSEELLDQYRLSVDDLKAQLEESERLRLKLEDQLRAVTSNQLEPPLKSDADCSPAEIQEKPSNIQTETLTERTESSQEQNIIRQEHPPLTPSILLHDSDGNLKEVLHTDTTPLSSSSSSPPPTAEGMTAEALLAVESTILQADQDEPGQNNHNGSSITDQPEETDDPSLSLCVEHHLPPDQEVLRRLTQEVQLLISEKEALNQRNQELLHQLTEASFEIERLRAELNTRLSETQHSPDEEPCHLKDEEEKLEGSWVEDLQVELSLRSQELLEAQSLISSLEESLRETGELLQLNNTAEKEEELKEDSKRKEDGHLCLEEKMQLNQSEQSCEELETGLKEAKELHHLSAEGAESYPREQSQNDEEGSRVLGSDEKIQRVMEGMGMRMKALDKLLEMMDEVDISLSGEEEEELTMKSQLEKEEQFLSSVISKLESNHSEETLLREVMERMMVEKQMLLVGLSLIPETDSCSEEEGNVLTHLDCFWKKDENKRLEIKDFKDIIQMKISLLNLLTSSITSSTLDRLKLVADRLSDSSTSDSLWFGLIISAADEALSCYLQSRFELRENIQPLPITSALCPNCVDVMKENQELTEKLSNREEEEPPSLKEHVDSSCQTEETQTRDSYTELQVEFEENNDRTAQEECVEVFPLCDDDDDDDDDDKSMEEKKEREEYQETEWHSETDEFLLLRGRVKELEEQLSIMEEMRARFDGKLSSVQTQHEREMEKLKATCKLGMASMEEAHLKVVEELQRRHQQEVERLLMERDKLLEEESAATATAIEAIKSAHRMELQREEQRRRQCENNSGNAHLEEIYRRHREELASCHRELQVLSQQFTLRCLEVGHLVQALEAERKALSVCQQENQHLRTRNQELSAHLAAEISRLCSQVKQDDLQLGQRMDVYEMEITLRVKESEVQSLKQETTSLKDELQTAQRDKRNATKKYKETFTELNILRAKTERETDELRENLRLAHRALDQTSP